MSAVLKAENVAVRTEDGATLVQPTALELRAGRPLTILGETGSGKSLLAHAMIGTLPHSLKATGTTVLGSTVFDLSRPAGLRATWGREVAILPQEPWLALDPLMKARAQVAEGFAYVGSAPWTEATRRADHALAELGLRDAGPKRPGELSGGMAQRVAFAAARTGGARIVIADEPTKGLDIARRDDVIALLMREVEENGALLTVTHDLDLARRMGGDVAIILDGRIVEQGSAAQVLFEPRHKYTRRLIAADPGSWPEFTHRALHGAPVISARNLGMSRGGNKLFRGIDLTLRPGEIVGVFGPSGCGKSTLGDLLLGLLQPEEGEVHRAAGVAPVRFQKLYQDPPSAFPSRIRLGQTLADLLRRHRMEPASVSPLLDRLRLSATLLSRRPDEVSGGELQRLALLRVLLLDPVFLFADEPTSRLDLITQKEVIDLLVATARETGMAMLIVSHDPELIRKSSDRVLQLGDEGASTSKGTARHRFSDAGTVR